jgi:dihydroflavonol-4-reductase
VAQRVFVTGGTGFVGKSVVRALLAQGFLVRLLVRPGSEHDLRDSSRSVACPAT